MAESQEKKDATKKRNVWSASEIHFFLSLIKEKSLLGLMDGKRIRVTEIFKTLIGPMKSQGFHRDAVQLITKYKNLKAEYFKCRRENSVSGNSPATFEYYYEMDDLLGHHLISRSHDGELGSDSLNSIPGSIMAESQEKKDTTKKRNVWSASEIQFFLSLIKEKHLLGLMDGKRIRVTDIFKTLIKPMKSQGFHRDAVQLITKYKNLKADYFKCRRENSISGNSHATFEYYDEMDDLLRHHPISQSHDGEVGFKHLSSIPVAIMAESQEKKDTTKKRNVWSASEIQFFLSLIKEKHLLGLMDGKRIRVTDIFKTLIKPMKSQGFHRDAVQLITKYKNLKAEYFKCRRENSVSGNSSATFEYYDEMDDLLGHHPISRSHDEEVGFESSIPVLIMAESQEKKDTMKKRNVWSASEILFFLSLIKEKSLLGLMDGKRIRVTHVFKTLIGPMKSQGFHRDAVQLITKYKNLKAEYFKCRRENSVSGNSPATFEYYDEMDDLLGHRPISQSHYGKVGFESLSSIPVVSTQEFGMKQENIEIKDYDNAPDYDGAIPGCSREPEVKRSIKKEGNETECRTKKNKKKEDPYITVLKQIEENRKLEVEQWKEFTREIMAQQERTLITCTNIFLEGWRNILSKD